MVMSKIIILTLFCKLLGSQYIPQEEISDRIFDDKIITNKNPESDSAHTGLKKNGEINNTVEETNIKCPSNMSSFTSNDLNDIIDSVLDKMKVYKTLNASYYSNAIKSVDDMKRQIIEFTHMFLDQPEHLKHILNHIALYRQSAELKITEVFNLFEKFPDIERKYSELSQKYEALLVKLNNMKKACNLYCDDYNHYCDDVNDELSNRAAMISSQSQLYCSTYRDVQNYINKKIESFVNETTKYLKIKLQTDRKAYIKEIDEFKQKLKYLTFKEYGQLMYNIVDIQDQYNHYFKILKQMEPQQMRKQIIVILEEISMDLVQFEDKINMYELYYKFCSFEDYYELRNRKRDSFKEIDNVETVASNQEENNVLEDSTKSILEELVNEKLKEIKSKIDEDYKSMFTDIDLIIENGNVTDSYISQLRKLLPKINDMTQKEIAFIEQLKAKLSDEAICDFKKLLDALTTLWIDIQITNEVVIWTN